MVNGVLPPAGAEAADRTLSQLVETWTVHQLDKASLSSSASDEWHLRYRASQPGFWGVPMVFQCFMAIRKFGELLKEAACIGSMVRWVQYRLGATEPWLQILQWYCTYPHCARP